MGKQTLESLGYDVVARNSSIEALELFKKKKYRFDLVITDMTMPNMTGEKLAEKLMQIRPDIPVILCTGFSSMIDEQKALDMGIRAFISKPILKREIAEAIRKVLDESSDQGSGIRGRVSPVKCAPPLLNTPCCHYHAPVK